MQSDDNVEIKHPTYGTIDQLLKEIKYDIMDGYELRIGLLGALSWFSDAYGMEKVKNQNKKK